MPGFRNALFNTLQPVFQWWGHLHMPFAHKKTDGQDFYTARSALQPGAVLLTRIEGEASNLFIPGFFTHAGIYTPLSGKCLMVALQAQGRRFDGCGWCAGRLDGSKQAST